MDNYAFYYPGLVWRNASWLKNMLLFFDGVALLVPEHLKDRVEEADPALVVGLQEHGLLRILEPETFINQAAAEELVTRLADFLAEGVFDNLVEKAGRMASHLSLSRLGQTADPRLAAMLLDELESRGLVGRASDGRSVSLHWVVRLVVLILLAQILRTQGNSIGLDLSPVTDRPNLHAALSELLDLPSMPSAGKIVSLDLQTVGVDLSAVPLLDILEFRESHGAQFKEYARGLRDFLNSVSLAEQDVREQLINDRQEWLRDMSSSLARQAKSRWQIPVSIALGLAGAAWSVKTGDPTAGLIGAASAVAAGFAPSERLGNASSYLFQARAITR